MTFRVGRSSLAHAFIRGLVIAHAATLLCACAAFAEPAVTVEYRAGVPYVTLDGSYRGSHYTVSRADAPNAEFRAITVTDALCLGECFGADETAEPGHTYYYRFDLAMADGTYLSYGPYAVTISAQLARRAAISISPNPVRHGARIEVLLAGRIGDPEIEARVAIYDLQGRERRVLHRGTLARGVTTLDWDGRDSEGRTLAAGVYLLRLDSTLGRSIARIVRVS